MKTLKKSVPIITVLLCILSVNAQTGKGFGIKAGLNYGGHGDYFESVSNSYQNPEANIGYHIGVFGKLGNKFYFRPELVYTKTKSDYVNKTFETSKLDIPLLVGVKVLGPISVFGGPSLQYILSDDFENNVLNSINLNDIENDFSIGLNFGFGINIGKVGLDLRYERGFSQNEATFIENNISTSDRLDTRPEQLILSLSLKL